MLESQLINVLEVPDYFTGAAAQWHWAPAPGGGTRRRHRATTPGRGTGWQHLAVAPFGGTMRGHWAEALSGGTGQGHLAAAPGCGTWRRHQATAPGGGTWRRHQAAASGIGRVGLSFILTPGRGVSPKHGDTMRMRMIRKRMGYLCLTIQFFRKPYIIVCLFAPPPNLYFSRILCVRVLLL